MPLQPTLQDRFIAGDQGRLFVRIWSPPSPTVRAPIVLFHDSLGSVELWREFPAALCLHSARPVIAYDRLGFGRSDPHPARLALDFVAGEAEEGFAALRRALAIETCVLFGHSVGGGMAVNCAARHPEACLALITESAQAFVEARTVQGIEAARELFRQPDQLARLEKYHGTKAAWVLDAWIGSWLHPEFASWSLDPVLPAVRCPTLALHGAEDEYGTPRHPERIGTLAGGPTRVLVLPDTRHVPHRERPQAVLDAVAAFLHDVA